MSGRPGGGGGGAVNVTVVELTPRLREARRRSRLRELRWQEKSRLTADARQRVHAEIAELLADGPPVCESCAQMPGGNCSECDRLAGLPPVPLATAQAGAPAAPGMKAAAGLDGHELLGGKAILRLQSLVRSCGNSLTREEAETVLHLSRRLDSATGWSDFAIAVHARDNRVLPRQMQRRFAALHRRGVIKVRRRRRRTSLLSINVELLHALAQDKKSSNVMDDVSGNSSNVMDDVLRVSPMTPSLLFSLLKDKDGPPAAGASGAKPDQDPENLRAKENSGSPAFEPAGQEGAPQEAEVSKQRSEEQTEGAKPKVKRTWRTYSRWVRREP